MSMKTCHRSHNCIRRQKIQTFGKTIFKKETRNKLLEMRNKVMALGLEF